MLVFIAIFCVLIARSFTSCSFHHSSSFMLHTYSLCSLCTLVSPARLACLFLLHALVYFFMQISWLSESVLAPFFFLLSLFCLFMHVALLPHFVDMNSSLLLVIIFVFPLQYLFLFTSWHFSFFLSLSSSSVIQPSSLSRVSLLPAITNSSLTPSTFYFLVYGSFASAGPLYRFLLRSRRLLEIFVYESDSAFHGSSLAFYSLFMIAFPLHILALFCVNFVFCF